MIKEITMYQAECDGCGNIYVSPVNNDWCWKSRKMALKNATNWGWEEIDGKLYCPDCFVWDRKNKCYKPKERSEQ